MPDVADYKVISNQPVILQTGGDIDHTLTFDLGTAVKHSQFAILQFYLEILDAEDMTLQFVLNGTNVGKFDLLHGRIMTTLHSTFTGQTQNGLNKLTIEIRSGTGHVKISDVVLFVQRRV
jgi:hypothetical protein